MELKNYLKLIPKKKFILTQKIKQAIKILEMTTPEIVEWIGNQTDITFNPIKSERISLDNFPAPEKSFYAKLLEQARLNFSGIDLSIAFFIIENLDERGFLSLSKNFIANKTSVSIKKVTRVLEITQTFDPVGIATKNLQESLLLQLKLKKRENSIEFQIIKNYFKEFLYLKKSLFHYFSKQEIETAIKNLRNLNFFLRSGTNSFPMHSIVPDIFIEYKNRKWSIEISKPYFKTTINSKWICLALKTREKFLEKISSFLIEQQKNFFLGKTPLVPITIKTLAEHLNLHVSTISRAIANKYISSPMGIFSLKSLFSSFFENSENEKFSKQLILKLIQKNINLESKTKPLTDSQLYSLLKLSCSRRTISKYRLKLNIPSSSKRKLLYKIINRHF